MTGRRQAKAGVVGGLIVGLALDSHFIVRSSGIVATLPPFRSVKATLAMYLLFCS